AAPLAAQTAAMLRGDAMLSAAGEAGLRRNLAAEELYQRLPADDAEDPAFGDDRELPDAVLLHALEDRGGVVLRLKDGGSRGWDHEAAGGRHRVDTGLIDLLVADHADDLVVVIRDEEDVVPAAAHAQKTHLVVRSGGEQVRRHDVFGAVLGE